MLPELRSRVSQAHSAFNLHREAMYQNKALSLTKRVRIFEACVLSVLNWGAGAWPPLKDAELSYRFGAMRRLVRRLLVRDYLPETLYTWTDLKLFSYVGILFPEQQLRILRLSYFGRLIRAGPDALWAFIVNDGLWLQQLIFLGSMPMHKAALSAHHLLRTVDRTSGMILF